MEQTRRRKSPRVRRLKGRGIKLADRRGEKKNTRKKTKRSRKMRRRKTQTRRTNF